MSSFGRDPVISGKTTIGRVEVKGTWPNLTLRINDMELKNILDASIDFGSRQEPPRLTIDLMVTDIDIEIDPALMEGSILVLKKSEDEKGYRADRIVLPEEDYPG